MTVVHSLLQRFLAPVRLVTCNTLHYTASCQVLDKLSKYAAGQVTLDKETLQKDLRLVQKIVSAISEHMAPELSGQWSSVLSTSLGWLAPLNIQLGGQSVRRTVRELMCALQDKMLGDRSDDTDSLTGEQQPG